jgi:hypothetical protein
MLRQLYLNGQARMARGDCAGAVAPFRVTSEVAPELAQTHYSLGLATMLADFAQRERALGELRDAVARTPEHPLYAIGLALADPALSVLGSDGALAFSAEGTRTVRAAASRLAGEPSAVNGRYLAMLLQSMEATADPEHPARLAGFARMIAPNGGVRLPNWRESQALGRLLAVSVAEPQFSLYEPRMIARLQNGIDSLSEQNQQLSRIRARLQAVRGQLIRHTPAGPLG